MSKSIYIILATLIFSNGHLFAQTKKQGFQTCSLLFQTRVGTFSFSFDSVYQNHSGESFKVRSFKYYISHVRFVYEGGKTIDSRLAPHLVNEADTISKQLQISVPEGQIAAIQFLAGIDSATSVNGVQTGDLDPAKGMFWIWNTGYIMAKLEGSSSSSKAPGKQFSYDIGGYKPGENTAKEISLSIAVSSQLSAISHQQPNTKYQSSTFLITADISKWFYGKNEIKIGEQPMCHAPGTLAMKVADNYADIFSIQVQ